MDIQISLANREDFTDMILLAGATLPDRMNLHELKKYFELFPQLLYKATDQGCLIGFACAGVDMFQKTGWLLYSNVAEGYQGKGIGKRLIEARINALKQIPSIERIRVTVSETNTASIKALQAHGLRFSHQELNYYGPGKHRDIMELSIIPAVADQVNLALMQELPEAR
ncbi:GNAT family N-acetyltransferase [Brevibacillus migulae]|uniref:GNAT family N-acetyltransferase n=1 Tax=Brevibacillus migulae TaxID=1644114 RepID=UPI00106E20C4|nr:GNAT family N-acetyltransferase [Brevibacillus migulae]